MSGRSKVSGLHGSGCQAAGKDGDDAQTGETPKRRCRGSPLEPASPQG
jgi:hypothetical protein